MDLSWIGHFLYYIPMCNNSPKVCENPSFFWFRVVREKEEEELEKFWKE